MRINIPATLTARVNSQSDEYPYADLDHYEVIVEFGDEEIVRLPTDEPVSKWDDDEAQESLVQKTVGKWLREKLT